MKRQFRTILFNLITIFFLKRRRKAVIKAGLNNQVATEKLTKEELLQLNQVWGKIMPITKNNGRFYELIKTYGGGKSKLFSRGYI